MCNIIPPFFQASILHFFCLRLENISHIMRLTRSQLCCHVVSDLQILTQGVHGMAFYTLIIHLNMLGMEVAVRCGLISTVLFY